MKSTSLMLFKNFSKDPPIRQVKELPLFQPSPLRVPGAVALEVFTQLLFLAEVPDFGNSINKDSLELE